MGEEFRLLTAKEWVLHEEMKPGNIGSSLMIGMMKKMIRNGTLKVCSHQEGSNNLLYLQVCS